MRLKTLEEYFCESIEDNKSLTSNCIQNNVINPSFPVQVYRYINVNPNTSLKTNINKDPLFVFVSRGNVTILVEDSFIVLQEYQCMFINKDRKFFVNSNSINQNQLTFISFDEKLVSMCVGNLIESKYVLPIVRSKLIDYHVFNGEAESDKKTILLLKKIIVAANIKYWGYELDIEIYLRLAWRELLDQLKKIIIAESSMDKIDVERMKTVLSYIKKHYSEKITLQNLADSVHLSREELCRNFKRLTNYTPFEFINKYRIDKSIEQLINSGKSITTIALDMGFSDSSNFSRIFKQFKECTPSEFRKNIKTMQR